MRGTRILVIFLSLLLSLPGQAEAPVAGPEDCKHVLNWIYKELTLNNLDLSYERTMNKFLLSLHHLQAKGNKRHLKDPQFEKIYETLSQIDPRFKEFKLSQKSFWRRIFGGKTKPLDVISLKTALLEWKKLQQSNPDMFFDMDKDYLLDDWDIQTVELIDHISDYPVTSPETKQSLEKLSHKINSSREVFLDRRYLDINNVKKDFTGTKKLLLKNLKDNYSEIMDEFSNVCSNDDMLQLLNEQPDNYVCPIPAKDSELQIISQKLQGLQDIFVGKKPVIVDLPINPVIPVDPVVVPPDAEVYVPVEKLEYETNEKKKNSTYCKRNPEIVTHIVIHHTGTPTDRSPIKINEGHLDRTSTSGEPWHMVGYNYLISESFQGATPDNMKVFQGRPADMQGAHAGGFGPKMTDEERKFFGKFKVQCGNKKIGFSNVSALTKVDDVGGMNGNLMSYGIAAIGDYAPVSWNYFGSGVFVPENIEAPKEYLPSANTIDMFAKFSCSLQKKNSKIKTIVPHNYFRGTKCPGTLILYLTRIAEKAREYGCEFQVKYNK